MTLFLKSRHKEAYGVLWLGLVFLQVFSLLDAVFAAERRPVVNDGAYGVFIDYTDSSSDMSEMQGYSTIVIDAYDFTADGIAQLHDRGQKVFSYLSIGAIKRSDGYYSDFSDITLGSCRDEENTYWVDVTQERWVNFFLDSLASVLRDKKVDGFLLDHTNIYDELDRNDIYDALVELVDRLDQLGVPIYVNNGYEFVDQLISDGKAGMIDGISVENVFTRIRDRKSGRYGMQEPSLRRERQSYLQKCHSRGLAVYMLEYSKSRAMSKRIERYAKDNGFAFYTLSRTLREDS